MSRTTRETMRAGKTCVFPSPLPVSTHPARDDPRTAAFSATATLMTHASTLPDPFPPHSTTLQRRRARPTLRAHHVRVGEARVHGSGPARRRGRRRAFRSTPRLGSRWDPDPDRVRLALRKKREDARGELGGGGGGGGRGLRSLPNAARRASAAALFAAARARCASVTSTGPPPDAILRVPREVSSPRASMSNAVSSRLVARVSTYTGSRPPSSG